MIELLPYFIAGTAVCTISAGATVGTVVKAPLLRLVSRNPAVRLPFGLLCGVAAAEVVILAISFFVTLSGLGPGPPAAGGSAGMAFGALVAASGMLAWAVGLLPNLYLLGKASEGAGTGARSVQRPGYAVLLAFQTPFFTFVMILLLYLSFR
jgi:hypothetical protein